MASSIANDWLSFFRDGMFGMVSNLFHAHLFHPRTSPGFNVGTEPQVTP